MTSPQSAPPFWRRHRLRLAPCSAGQITLRLSDPRQVDRARRQQRASSLKRHPRGRRVSQPGQRHPTQVPAHTMLRPAIPYQIGGPQRGGVVFGSEQRLREKHPRIPTLRIGNQRLLGTRRRSLPIMFGEGDRRIGEGDIGDSRRTWARKRNSLEGIVALAVGAFHIAAYRQQLCADQGGGWSTGSPSYLLKLDQRVSEISRVTAKRRPRQVHPRQGNPRGPALRIERECPVGVVERRLIGGWHPLGDEGTDRCAVDERLDQSRISSDRRSVVCQGRIHLAQRHLDPCPPNQEIGTPGRPVHGPIEIATGAVEISAPESNLCPRSERVRIIGRQRYRGRGRGGRAGEIAPVKRCPDPREWRGEGW